jgi:enamine deaminase RidA (YjgF/YER057c/UK114 family)
MLREQVMYIQPEKTVKQCSSSMKEQVEECLHSIEKFLAACRLETRDILKQTVFLKSADNNDFYAQKRELSTLLKDFYKSFYPPTGFIGQPPVGGALIAFELMVITPRDDRVVISRKELDGLRYTTVNYPGRREVYAVGITAGKKAAGTLQQSKDAFRLMKRVLEKENMDFSHIVRQWNYIENITGKITNKDETRQNYQVFNDIRSLYYGEVDFKRGYPAATGIGMECGGVVLEFIAADVSGDMTVIPIKNPDQVDAHRYSREVLVGNAIQADRQKSTPKFERAKAIAKDNYYYVYISGTAAIRGQKTLCPTDVEQQTRVTIENISRLIAPDNLEKHNLPVSSSDFPFSHIRVYVKNETDVPAVKKICDKHYGEVPCLYLVSDICRENLLVEIEGAIALPALSRER